MHAGAWAFRTRAGLTAVDLRKGDGKKGPEPDTLMYVNKTSSCFNGKPSRHIWILPDLHTFRTAHYEKPSSRPLPIRNRRNPCYTGHKSRRGGIPPEMDLGRSLPSVRSDDNL